MSAASSWFNRPCSMLDALMRRDPRPPLPLAKSPILLPEGRFEVDEHGHVVGQAIRQCKDHVHVFADFGECQCGKETWPAPFYVPSDGKKS